MSKHYKGPNTRLGDVPKLRDRLESLQRLVGEGCGSHGLKPKRKKVKQESLDVPVDGSSVAQMFVQEASEKKLVETAWAMALAAEKAMKKGGFGINRGQKQALFGYMRSFIEGIYPQSVK